MANSVPPRPDVEGMRRAARVSDDTLGRLCIVAERSDGCMIQGGAVLGNSLSLDLRDCRAALAAETKRADAAEREVAIRKAAEVSEERHDEHFAKALAEAHKRNDIHWLASLLSGRLQRVDRRAKAANARADAAEFTLAAETAARIAAEAKVGEMVEALRRICGRVCPRDFDDAIRLVAQHDAKGKEAGDA